MDLRQSKEYGEYQHKNGWLIEKTKNGIQVFIRTMPVLSVSVMKLQRFEKKINWEEIRSLKKKHRVLYTVLEPGLDYAGDLEEQGFRRNKDSYLPSKTLVGDLKKSEEELWKELSKDARQRIKKISGLHVLELKNTPALEEFWREWKKAGKAYVPGWATFGKLKDSFRKNCRIWAVIRGDRMIAGSVVLIFKKTAYYYFAWTNEEGRKANAQYLLVWDTMRQMKRIGCESWDFEGIEDERNKRKSWQGFTTFKKKFGGEEISFPGCWEKWF